MNRAERTEADSREDHGLIGESFMDCKTIVRALYPDRFPAKPVRWDAAYRWLADAGVGR